MKPEPQKTSINKFFTAEVSNAGKVLYLEDEYGNKTEDWVKVLGGDSDAYEDGLVANRAGLSSDDSKEIKSAVCKLYSSLITEWSFFEELTPESAYQLFTNAPHVRKQVVRFVDDRKAFFSAPAKP